MNKFIQSFIETNWLTDDDDDDGDDDDDDDDAGGARVRARWTSCHSGKQAQHAQLVNLVAACILHFKSCVWAGQIFLFLTSISAPFLVACPLCSNSAYFVIRGGKRLGDRESDRDT